jgi:hypothetical protein
MVIISGDQCRRDDVTLRPDPMSQVIYIHAGAPAKSESGTACNGCGVCCLAEPCPVGMVVSRKRRGACSALAWVEAQQRYRCGMMSVGQTWPRSLRWLSAPLQRWMQRFIAAGVGCDSDVQASAPAAGGITR